MNLFLARYHVLDLILAAMLLEGVILTTLRAIRPAALLPNLASGMCLIAAMRLALSGVAWPFISLLLLGALAFHLVDLRQNWRA